MKRKLLPLVLFMFLSMFISYALSSGYIDLIDGGTFQYTDAFNISNGSNWVFINCTGDSANYTIQSGENWEVDCGSGGDTLPYDGFIGSAILYNGIYYINNSVSSGALNLNTDDILDCNEATLIGYGTGKGITNELSINHRGTIKNCIVTNYLTGIWVNVADNYSIYNNIAYKNNIGIYTQNGVNNGNISYNILYNNSVSGIRTNGNNTKIYNNVFWDNGVTTLFADNNYYNIFIANNYIYNVSNGDGIRVEGGHNHYIYNNTVLDENCYICNTDSKGIGCYDVTGDNVTITANRVNGFDYGIRTQNMPNSYISNNIVSNTGMWGIAFDDDSSIIENNIVYNSTWNNIKIEGNDGIVRNNYVENFRHHGIDIHNDGLTTIADNISIYNNTIRTTSPLFIRGDIGIALTQGANLKVFDNDVICNINDSCVGITSEGGNQSPNNHYYNNTITATSHCMYDSSNNTLWESNNLLSCGNYDVAVFGGYPAGYENNYNYANFKNNNYVNGISKYEIFSLSYVDFEINETSTTYHLIHWNNNNAELYLNGNFRKDLSVINNTLQIVSLPGATIYNGTNLIGTDIINYNITANSAETWYIYYLAESTLLYANYDYTSVRRTALPLGQDSKDFIYDSEDSLFSNFDLIIAGIQINISLFVLAILAIILSALIGVAKYNKKKREINY